MNPEKVCKPYGYTYDEKAGIQIMIEKRTLVVAIIKPPFFFVAVKTIISAIKANVNNLFVDFSTFC